VGADPVYLVTTFSPRLWLDPVVVVLLVAGHCFTAAKWGWPTLLEGVALSSRPALYSAAAIVLALTGTLGSVSVAQYLQARGERAKELKRRHPGELGNSWKSIFGSTVLGSLFFLMALRLDSSAGARPAFGSSGTAGEWVFEIGALVALVALARLFFLFGQLIDLIVLDDTDPLPDEEDGIDDDFFAEGDAAPLPAEPARR
jgi:hypothetical protein